MAGCFRRLLLIGIILFVLGVLVGVSVMQGWLPDPRAWFDQITTPGTQVAISMTNTPFQLANPTATPADTSCSVDDSAVSAQSADARPTVVADVIRRLPNGRQVTVNVPNRPPRNLVLIHFIPGATRQQINEYIRSIGGRSRRQVERLQIYAVILSQDTDIASLPTSPIVELIEQEQYVGALIETPTNDVRFAEQWALPVMGVYDAWRSLPANPTPVTVAVIDSGVCLSHPDLQGRIGTGYDFVQDDNNPQDDFGHGCGVAGVIAANINNGIGIAGVAPNAQIMPIRVLDAQGLGNHSDVAAGIIYAADNGARIINLSLAGPNTTSALNSAIDYAISRGVIVIAAAGNSGQPTLGYPAAYPPVIAVGSIDTTLERSSFSNYGTGLDIMAPGRDIYTTNRTNDYSTMTGTSFAAPNIAGLAALKIALGQPVEFNGGGVVYVGGGGTGSC